MHFILNTGCFPGSCKQLYLKWIFSDYTLDCNYCTEAVLHNRIMWWCRQQHQQQQQFGYTGLKRQLNKSDCLANQRIYLAFISFNPPSLIRLWLHSNVHPVPSQEQTAHNHSLWWGHPSMQHEAQSWIGTVWSEFGTGRQSCYSKAGTWLNQSVSSQVWALDGIIKAGVHKKQQTIKGTSWPPHSAWQTHSSLPKESFLFGKWLIGCGDVVPCMAERCQDRKKERKANSEGRSW